MTQLICSLCSRVVVTVEGGYNLNQIAKSSEAVLRALLNAPMPNHPTHHEELYIPVQTDSTSEISYNSSEDPEEIDNKMLLFQADRLVRKIKKIINKTGTFKCFKD